MSSSQLCTLLETDIDAPGEVPLGQIGTHISGSLSNRGQQREKVVSFDLFKDHYWPHFPQSLTKGLGESNS